MDHRARLRSILLIAFVALAPGAAPSAANWELPPPPATGIAPEAGEYTFSSMGTFRVVRDGAADAVLRFASDGFRFDAIPIVDGAFFHTHGEIGGSHCPNDAYGISGAFTTPTRAEGTIHYGSECQITARESFVAELDAECDPPSCLEVASIAELRDAIRDAFGSTVTIRIAPGTYTVSETIVVARDDIRIEGSGEKATTLRLAENTNEPIIVIGAPVPEHPDVTHRRIHLRNLRLDGTWELQSEGEDCPVAPPGCSGSPRECSCTPGREHLRNNCITVRQADQVLLQDLVVESCASGGIIAEQRVRGLRILGVEAARNRYDGIAWDGDVAHSRVIGSVLHSNLAAGLSLDLGPRDNDFQSLDVHDNGRGGIFLSDADRNTFTGVRSWRNGEDGVFVRDGDAPDADAVDNLFVDSAFVGNARNGFWQAGERSTGNRVEDSVFRCNGDQPLVAPVGAPVAGETHLAECACRPSESIACLVDDRFRVTVTATGQQGPSVPGRLVTTSADSAVFWFFSRDNWELTVKVLDGCDLNGHYWVFASASTDVHYRIDVLDTDSDLLRQYTNPAGNRAAAINDTAAFATCP